MSGFSDIFDKKECRHKWSSNRIHSADECKKCGREAGELMLKVQHKIPELSGQPITKRTLDVFEPCITDNEALIKDILE